MKALTKRHVCKKISGGGLQYIVVKSTQSNSWQVRIPDFLDTANRTVMAFVYDIEYCPFCGVRLETTSAGIDDVKPSTPERG